MSRRERLRRLIRSTLRSLEWRVDHVEGDSIRVVHPETGRPVARVELVGTRGVIRLHDCEPLYREGLLCALERVERRRDAA